MTCDSQDLSLYITVGWVLPLERPLAEFLSAKRLFSTFQTSHPGLKLLEAAILTE